MTRLLRERILSRVAKEKKPGQVRKQERAFKPDMQKKTILKAQEISIEHLRKVPGRFQEDRVYKNWSAVNDLKATIGDEKRFKDHDDFKAAALHVKKEIAAMNK